MYYNAETFSTLDPVSSMKCPGASTSPLPDVVTNERLRRINWLLNNYYNPLLGLSTSCYLPVEVAANTYENAVRTAPGWYSPVDKNDMQSAMWYLTGGSVHC